MTEAHKFFTSDEEGENFAMMMKTKLTRYFTCLYLHAACVCVDDIIL